MLKEQGPSAAAAQAVGLAPDLLAGDSTFFSEVLGLREHEDRIINLQCGAQFDLHHLDDVCLCQKQEGFAINLLFPEALGMLFTAQQRLYKLSHLIHRPSGHLACLDVGHPWKQLAVLLPAEGEVPEGVGRQGCHEDRLVQRPLCLLSRVFSEEIIQVNIFFSFDFQTLCLLYQSGQRTEIKCRFIIL